LKGPIINYKYLYYFWSVTKESNIARVSERLNMTSLTISGQLNLIEGELGESPYNRIGHNLEITETGCMICKEASIDVLHTELSVHHLDLVLADHPEYLGF
jgi:hypothetical protein